MKIKSIVAVVVPALFALVACGGDGGKPALNLSTKISISDADRTFAKEHMNTYCSTCHGTSGKGDGVAGKGLPVKPRDWTDAGWQKNTSDDDLFKVIQKGGPAVGLSPLMTPTPHADKPGVVGALVEIVREYGNK